MHGSQTKATHYAWFPPALLKCSVESNLKVADTEDTKHVKLFLLWNVRGSVIKGPVVRSAEQPLLWPKVAIMGRLFILRTSGEKRINQQTNSILSVTQQNLRVFFSNISQHKLLVIRPSRAVAAEPLNVLAQTNCFNKLLSCRGNNICGCLSKVM